MSDLVLMEIVKKIIFLFERTRKETIFLELLILVKSRFSFSLIFIRKMHHKKVLPWL